MKSSAAEERTSVSIPYDDAYKQVSKVTAMDAGFSEAYLWRGRALLQQGEYPAAVADLETVHRLNQASQIISPTLAYASLHSRSTRLYRSGSYRK